MLHAFGLDVGAGQRLPCFELDGLPPQISLAGFEKLRGFDLPARLEIRSVGFGSRVKKDWEDPHHHLDRISASVRFLCGWRRGNTITIMYRLEQPH